LTAVSAAASVGNAVEPGKLKCVAVTAVVLILFLLMGFTWKVGGYCRFRSKSSMNGI
jgi:hypothetical protein